MDYIYPVPKRGPPLFSPGDRRLAEVPEGAFQEGDIRDSESQATARLRGLHSDMGLGTKSEAVPDHEKIHLGEVPQLDQDFPKIVAQSLLRINGIIQLRFADETVLYKQAA